MLEKIGLPAKPSQRGNNWVVDASHCQGCSTQFTFINRKHHCRRCGGLFCNTCTQQRMVLRGQGDSPVRVCEPCKKLEEAARFELRYGHRNRAGKGTGSSRSVSKDEDEILNQIIGSDRKEYSSQGFASLDGRSNSLANEPNLGNGEEGSASPQELRQRALEERKLYKALKAERKSAEALKAFKRGKELERQADALEISLRRNRRKGLSSDNSADIDNKDGSKGSSRRGKLPSQVGKEKDDLFAELRELGWSDMDNHGDDKKSSNMTLEGELSSLIKDSSEGTNTNAGIGGIDKTQVVAHKRKALALKREGKLAEAKEELKKAKVLEKQLEEQELLGAVADSDDEISALIESINNDEHDDLLFGHDQQHDFDINQLMGTGDDHDVGGNLDVTDEDFMDPEIAATLKSLGWTDDSDAMDTVATQWNPVDRETLLLEIHSLKREALDRKRAGNIPEAMAMLKKAKLLEKNIESLPDEVGNLTRQNPSLSDENSTSKNASTKKDMGSTVEPKSRLVIQKELLAIKKKALSLRREGKLDEADEELKRGNVLEQQLEVMDNTSKARTEHVSVGNKDIDLGNEHPDVSGSHLTGEEEGDVTDQDMVDPAYLSVLRNLGWQDQDSEHKDHAPKLAKKSDKLHGQETEFLPANAASSVPLRASRKSKAEIQSELLGLKRKALALRREGKSDEAEEVLRSAKELEDQMAEMEAPKKEIDIESKRSKDETIKPSHQIGTDENDVEDVSEKDLYDPALLSMLNNLGWKDEQSEPVITEKPKSKGEIQRELLNLKRKALAHRRKGEMEEAEKLVEMAKGLEAQLEALQEVKKEPLSDAYKDRKSEDFDLGKQGVINNLMDDSKKSASVVVGQNEKLESFREIGRQNSDVIYPVTKSVGNSNPEASHVIKDNSPLLGELVSFGQTEYPGNRAANKNPGPSTLHHGSINAVDSFTGDKERNPEEAGDKTKKHLPEAHVEEKLWTSPLRSLENKEEKEDAKLEKIEVTADEKQNVVKANSTSTSTSESKQHSPQQEVLARKRKAVALKREGKLAEAREELRQAKLLEKSLEEVTPEPETSKEVSKHVSNSPPVQQKEVGASNLAQKPLSSRDRFKLQQESLSHKRQALKLRREGRMDEAEAEFELAKSLESQLEESSSQGSANADETADGVVVEDLLDPQLLSALRAIGIGDTDIAFQVPAKSGPTKVSPNKNEAGPFNASPVKSEAGSTKVSPVKTESVNQERVQLEERIKAEKVKAVNLKRSGKQAEALDALRRAKIFEKKLNSLASN